MSFSPLLVLYRLAWEPALILARGAWATEQIFCRITGRALWPARWRLGERLGYGHTDVTSRDLSSPSSHTSVPALWMHAASLGECKGLWATAEGLADRFEKAGVPARFVLTANTVEGLAHLKAQVQARRDRHPEEAIRWIVRLAPLDHPRVVRGFRETYHIGSLLLFEIELWPHFIAETRRTGDRVLWISAQAARSASRLCALLPRIDWIQAQTDDDALALRKLGARVVETGADLRGLHSLDLAPQVRTDVRTDAGTDAGQKDWSARAGIALVSIHADELGAILTALRNIPAEIPVFVFPRKPHEFARFAAALAPLGFTRHSHKPDLTSGPLRQIVDAFGLVDEILRRCRVAVIGGSFAPHGGHNLWEPLKAGVGMFIGPYHESQRYLAAKLVQEGLLRVTQTTPDAAEWVALHGEPDPGDACRHFAVAESTRLQESLEAVFAQLRNPLLGSIK